MRIPCVRCLLREMDEQTALQQVLDFQRSVPKMEQADPSQYETPPAGWGGGRGG